MGHQGRGRVFKVVVGGGGHQGRGWVIKVQGGSLK